MELFDWSLVFCSLVMRNSKVRFIQDGKIEKEPK